MNEPLIFSFSDSLFVCATSTEDKLLFFLGFGLRSVVTSTLRILFTYFIVVNGNLFMNLIHINNPNVYFYKKIKLIEIHLQGSTKYPHKQHSWVRVTNLKLGVQVQIWLGAPIRYFFSLRGYTDVSNTENIKYNLKLIVIYQFRIGTKMLKNITSTKLILNASYKILFMQQANKFKY